MRAVPDLVEPAFRGLAAARDAKAFHPRGRWFDGTLTTTFDPALPLPVGVTEVSGRLSKGAGTPGGLPDVLGLAFRLPGPWDVLLSTCVARVLPRFARTWTSGRYGSISPFRWRGRLVWLAAVPDDHRLRSTSLAGLPAELGFTLEVGAPWRPVGRLVVRPLDVDRDLPALDPIRNRPPGLDLAPAALARVRERAYRGSRRGRSPDPVTAPDA
ncbi:hypothetical protein IOD16_24600 [Saccharothrix sp. 6-C]|uniref:Phosphodiesterase n=1 Tax=Saccharothrix texasensis TaxID=103734 RepID=A0A3N1HH10_9PSEU|nr:MULTISPECIES: hypothetical protein [Saccharothrix]QQQ74354.1 hypothetical protein IOD16_24600 [Saccharothrix sp. 6-C]ROP41612.1 hypothetical protein EDD40_7048 [Saccharothrix texasensis]